LYGTPFDTDSSVLQVTTNGAISTSGVFDDPNTALSAASRDSIFPFWDEQLRLQNGTLCAALDPTSAAPSRRFVVTWKDFNLEGLPNARISFSAVLQEGTDNIYFLYHRWASGSALTNCSSTNVVRVMGASATVGVTGNFGEEQQVFAPSTPETTAMLASHPIGNCFGNGRFVKLTATPTNP
jgi:hypothetical protein